MIHQSRSFDRYDDVFNRKKKTSLPQLKIQLLKGGGPLPDIKAAGGGFLSAWGHDHAPRGETSSNGHREKKPLKSQEIRRSFRSLEPKGVKGGPKHSDIKDKKKLKSFSQKIWIAKKARVENPKGERASGSRVQGGREY